MYSIRIQRPAGHTMIQCTRYSVTQGDTPGTCKVQLLGAPDGDTTVDIGRDDTAFVMNDRGHTVDTIRPAASSRASTFRTGGQG